MNTINNNVKTKRKKVLAISGCFAVQICVGILYVWSVFRESVIAYYGWSPGQVNLVASFMLFAFCAGNLAGGIIQDRKGPRFICFIGIFMFGGGMLLASFIPAGSSIIWFYLTYCVVAGIGCGLCYGPVLVCMQKWFPEKRGFATGLAAGAFGISTVIFAPIATLLIHATDASRAIRILAVIFLSIGIAACFMISVPENTSDGMKTHDDATSLSPLQAVRTLTFWLFFTGCFLITGTWNMLSPIIKTLGTTRNLSDTAATICVTLTGIANAAGRLIMSSLSDKIGRIVTLIILCGITAISGIALVFSGDWVLFGIVLMTAFAYGGPAAVNPATTTDFFGPKYAGSNYGIIMLSLGMSSVIFNLISNALYSISGNYTITFIVGAVSAGISLIIYYIISRLEKVNPIFSTTNGDC